MASRLTTIIVVAIVAATVIAGLIVGAQRDDNSGPVDLVIFNGKVYTADGAGRFAEAVAVRGNQILRVGTNREIKRLRRAQTMVVDAHGGAVLPGFNDSHAHFASGGMGLESRVAGVAGIAGAKVPAYAPAYMLDLLEATTLEEIGEQLRGFAAANPDRAWILGRGWRYAPFPGGLPTRQQLDALVPDRPAYLRCYDGHTGWANSKALALAGITRRTRNPKNGIIVKDPRTGEPTGVLKEAAQRLMDKVLPQPGREDRLHAIRVAMEYAHRFGVTSVQNASGGAEEFDLYDELRRAGDLTLRVYSAVSISPGFTDADAERIDQIRKKYPDDPLFKTGAVKLVADGVIEAHTAAMLAPYSNKATSGSPNYSPGELDRIVAMLDRRGWQIMIHAIGDGGVRMALDAFERAAASNPEPARGRRHRIEHIGTIDAADVPRFGKLGVIASQQPYHANPSANQLDVWSANMGPERAARGWLWKHIKAAGGRLAFGSDWPVVPIDPLLGLHMAVNRAPTSGAPPESADGWLPAERLTLPQAIDAYTSGAAYASFDEQRKGTLAKGMLADLVILSGNIFDQPPARLLDAVVDVTVFDGKIVYRRDKSTTEP